MSEYDLVVIGGGPGGYVAAIKAAQMGLKTACIDKQTAADGSPVLGGTCLNVGCIPSKALLDSSHQYEFFNKEGKKHGLVGSVKIDISQMQKRKETVVKNLTQGISGLLKKNNVEWLHGFGSLKSKNVVQCTSEKGLIKNLSTKNVLLASGSLPSRIQSLPIDNEYIFDSSGALEFKSAPKKLCIIGAGVIGLELGSVWRRLGSNVTVLEAQTSFLDTADKDVSAEALKLFKKQGLKIELGTLVTEAKIAKEKVTISYEKGAERLESSFDKVVVAVGRSPYTEGLNLDEAGVKSDDKGFILVNEFNETSTKGIFAIGDCTLGPMLAHKASEEGILVAEHMAGAKAPVEIAHVPWIIYTWPEIAWVGPSEQFLRNTKKEINIGKFPFRASGRSHARGETEGFVKIIAEKNNDQILAVHILGSNASELISEAVTAMEFGATSEDVARIIHGHPTLSESMHEAALATLGNAIHY